MSARRTEIGLVYAAGLAGLGLAAFWAMVTIGRLAVAVLSVWVPARRIYLTLPVLLLLAFVGIPQVSGPVGNLVAFGFAGLACSALLPLSIKSAFRRRVSLP